MGSIISAIHDDIEEYKSLCKKYGEQVQYSKDAYGYSTPDCYSKHATELRARSWKEWQESKDNGKDNTN